MVFERSGREKQHKTAVKEAQEDLDAYVKNRNYRFTIDTNYIIILAEFGEEDILLNVANCPSYVLSDVIYGELKGISKSLSRRAKKIIDKFLRFAEKRRVKIDTSAIEKALKPLASLLPRKIVNDVIISLSDSFINNLIKIYEELKAKMIKGILTLSDRARATNYYRKEQQALSSKVRERYEKLCNEFRIDRSKIDEEEYFRHVQRFINEYLTSIKNTLGKSKSLIELLKQLRMITKKSYEPDIRYVAHTIAQKAKARSFDSDVIWLLRFHALKRAS